MKAVVGNAALPCSVLLEIDAIIGTISSHCMLVFSELLHTGYQQAITTPFPRHIMHAWHFMSRDQACNFAALASYKCSRFQLCLPNAKCTQTSCQ